MAVEAGKQPWWTKPWPLHLGLCACAVVVVLSFGNPLETQELQWFGQCLRWRFAAGWAPPVERSIVHLNIDQEDLRTLSTLESEYSTAARIIREASALGASVIAFDTIFTRANPETARPLLDAIAEHKNVVLAEALNAAPGAVEPSVLIRSFPFKDPPPAPGGLINLSADADGVIRHYDLIHRSKGGYEPSLALAVYFAVLGLDWKRDVSFPNVHSAEWHELSTADFITMIPRRVPTGPVLLNIRCPWAVESGPAAFDYMNLRQLDALFEKIGSAGGMKPLNNKIVFVGYVAIGQGDVGPTVFGPHEPLIYLHSTALDDLMQSRWVKRSGRLVDALWLLSALLMWVGARWCRYKWSLVLWWALGIAGVIAVSGTLLMRLNLVVPTVATLTLWSLAAVLEIARRHTSELAERQRLRSTMGLYFSPRILNDVLKNPGRLEPKRVEITVLLTDLRNSTALAEQLGTEGMLNLLNQIFTVENSAVFAEEGSMEKPVGDQFLAYWGAPDPQPDAADRALRAALMLIEGMQKLRETFDSQTRELFGYGVALHAGESLIANIGSAQFFHYGPIGDLMNATARVESLTKYYGVLALATREFCNRLSHPPDLRIIDRVVVKGKSVPLELIELRHTLSPENFQEIANSYAAAFACYQEGKFGEASRLFGSLRESDKPSRVMAERCADFAAHPPQDWRGVFAFAAK
jgi:class 3 adenylate cyclase/CHASE2 domain-containing sensor protein